MTTVRAPDEKRLSWLETATASVHCNYMGGDEAWTVSVCTADFAEEKQYHGESLRAAIDKAILSDVPSLPSSQTPGSP